MLPHLAAPKDVRSPTGGRVGEEHHPAPVGETGRGVYYATSTLEKYRLVTCNDAEASCRHRDASRHPAEEKEERGGRGREEKEEVKEKVGKEKGRVPQGTRLANGRCQVFEVRVSLVLTLPRPRRGTEKIPRLRAKDVLSILRSSPLGLGRGETRALASREEAKDVLSIFRLSSLELRGSRLDAWLHPSSSE